MARLTFLFVYALISSDLTAATTPPLQILAITKVYDGDTFTVDLANCAEPIVCRDVPIRVAGIDAPEIKAQCGAEAAKADRARTWLKRRLNTGRPVELKNVVRDKYFRLRAEVYIGDKMIAPEMVALGLARPYNGGARAGWCGTK